MLFATLWDILHFPPWCCHKDCSFFVFSLISFLQVCLHHTQFSFFACLFFLYLCLDRSFIYLFTHPSWFSYSLKTLWLSFSEEGRSLTKKHPLLVDAHYQLIKIMMNLTACDTGILSLFHPFLLSLGLSWSCPHRCITQTTLTLLTSTPND